MIVEIDFLYFQLAISNRFHWFGFRLPKPGITNLYVSLFYFLDPCLYLEAR